MSPRTTGDAGDRIPTLHLIVGLPGAGKTTEALRLAEDRGALRFTPDEWMMPLFGLEFATEEWAAKRDVVEARLIAVARQALDQGVDVVLDFGFWGREERDGLRWLAGRHRADARVVYLPIDPVTQLERVARRRADAPAASFEMSSEDLRGWREQFQEPDPDELAGTAPLPDRDWATWLATRWPTALD